MTDLIELGRRMNTARTKMGMSLDEVAAEVGVATSTIQRYEKGRIARIKLPVIESIAYALHVDPDWLLQKTDEPYDYTLDRDNRLNDIPTALFKQLMEQYNNPGKVYRAWQGMEGVTADEVAYDAYVAHIREECKKIGLVISDTDPQINSILEKAKKLNAQGLEKLDSIADDLVASGKYSKIVYTSDVAARSGEKGKTVMTKEQADEVLRLLDSAPDDQDF